MFDCFIFVRMVALPDAFHCLEEKAGIDKRISKFVATIASTICRAGSSMFISLSCIFIIQLVPDVEDSVVNTILVM